MAPGRSHRKQPQSGPVREWGLRVIMGSAGNINLGQWSGLELLFWTIFLIARLMMAGASDPTVRGWDLDPAWLSLPRAAPR